MPMIEKVTFMCLAGHSGDAVFQISGSRGDMTERVLKIYCYVLP